MFAALLAFSGAFGQLSHSNPWAPTVVAPIPPVASLADGVWMKGDLHLHSRHSHDASNNPIAKMIAFALSVGMDYIAITDHDNHVDGDVADHTWADPEFHSDSLLLLYSAEWTTTRGHGNVFSAHPYDHQRLFDVRDQRDVVIGAIKRELGVHLSANHPSGKDHFGFSYDMVGSIEVWNSATWSKNAAALMIWDDMLSSGRRLTGRGGSDSHHGMPDSVTGASLAGAVAEPAASAAAVAAKHLAERQSNYIGTPTTWVFAKERSRQAVVDALTNGRVSISANPFSPRVGFYADLDQDGKMDMMMGDNAAATGKPVRFKVVLAGKLSDTAHYSIDVIKNGDPFATYTMIGAHPQLDFTDTPSRIGRTYYRLEVHGMPSPYPQVPASMALTGNMIGLSNPIYFNFDPNF